MTAISVACIRADAGHRCTVAVGDDRRATRHEVTVSDAVLERLLPGGTGTVDAERVVRASFAFLLEREPREAILRTFDLPVMGRYFPEYEKRIERSLQGEGPSAP